MWSPDFNFMCYNVYGKVHADLMCFPKKNNTAI